MLQAFHEWKIQNDPNRRNQDSMNAVHSVGKEVERNGCICSLKKKISVKIKFVKGIFYKKKLIIIINTIN